MKILNLTLAQKTEAVNMQGCARLTFYKSPDDAMAGRPVEMPEAGALDMALLSAEAATYKVGAQYAITISELIKVAEPSAGDKVVAITRAQVAGGADTPDPSEALPLP